METIETPDIDDNTKIQECRCFFRPTISVILDDPGWVIGIYSCIRAHTARLVIWMTRVGSLEYIVVLEHMLRARRLGMAQDRGHVASGLFFFVCICDLGL